ncbi:MAG: serine/threonine protein kinase [Planctomycetia bacterium]|nr:serine/threonine protein kinase [Planctomycetia bacterium]
MSHLSDDEEFRHLEAYLSGLHQGQPPDVEPLLSKYPQLRSAVDCLKALDEFAPSRAPADGPGEQTGQWRHTPTVHPGDLTPSQCVAAEAGNALGDDVLSSLVFGEYDLCEEIGRGGMGVVYRARQCKLDRSVAIKMIASHLATRDAIALLQQEAKAAAALSHPNIVDIYQVGEVFGQHYIAMKYVGGPSLAARLQGGPLDPSEAARLLVVMARAVQHLHSHGVVHRDLKPSNILFDEEGNPFVSDFGLAKVGAGDALASGAVAGTPPYMSPEQAGGGEKTPVGPASDIYSLGAILFEMLTGRAPFTGDTSAEILMKVLEEDPPRPRALNSQVPWELQTICLKCLEKSPAERYASAAALADDLERFLRHDALEAQPPAAWQRVWRWARREPALATRVVAIPFFYLIRRIVDGGFNPWTASVVLLWIGLSVVCQRCLRSPRWAMTARFAWGAVDVVCLVLLLLMMGRQEGVMSPLIVAFPLLIVGSGIWFHRRLVWFVTGLSIAGYLVLMIAYALLHGSVAAGAAPQAFEPLAHPRFHIYFILAMAVLGCVVAYQVSRVRALTQYFDKARGK